MLRHLDISTNCSSSWTVTLHKQFVNCQCIVYFGLELSSAKQKANIAADYGWVGEYHSRRRGEGSVTLVLSVPRGQFALSGVTGTRGYCDVYWGQVPVNLPLWVRSRVRLRWRLLVWFWVHIKRLFALNCKRNELVHTLCQRQRLSRKLMSRRRGQDRVGPVRATGGSLDRWVKWGRWPDYQAVHQVNEWV